MKAQTGTPTIEGRYVVFTPCASQQVRDWCEPEIATWHGGRWHYGRTVCGWIGPLPIVKVAALQQEYDRKLGALQQEYDL